MSVDPLAADFASYSPYNYVLGNPILMIDPDGRSAEKVDNEYVKDKDSGEVVMVGTKGGDETDYVYDGSIERDGDGNVSTVKWSESSAQVLDVKTEYTSGPGTWQGEKGVATPGERSVHGKNHTDLVAYSILADFFSGGSASGASHSLGFAKNLPPRVPKGQAFLDIVKNKVVKGGQFMRKKMDGYWQLLKKGEKGKLPTGTHTTAPANKKDPVREMLEAGGKFLNGDYDGPPTPGG